MKVNRFTNIQPAQYNPMGLQELMMVPMLKRQQHDELLSNVSTTQADLAQRDYMDMHGEEVLGLKQKMEDELRKQVDTVSANGISGSLRSDFTRLNADYQAAKSPKGLFGRAGAAKAALQQERDTFIANDTKNGFSAEDAKRNWDLHEEQYREKYEKTGKIESIDPLYGPNRVDYISEFRDMVKDVGLTGTDVTDIDSYFKQDEYGTYVVTERGREALKSNEENIAKFENWMTNRVMNPNSDLAKSYMHEGKTTEDVLQELKGLGDVYTRKETITEEGNKTISNVKYFGDGTKAKDEKPKKRKNIYTTSGYTNPLVSDGSTAAEMSSIVAATRQNPHSSSEEIEYARSLEENLNEADKHFRGEGFDQNGNPLPKNNRYNYYKDKLKIVDDVRAKLEVGGTASIDPMIAFGQIRGKHRINTGDRYSYEELPNGNYALYNQESSASGQTTRRRLSKGSITPAEYKKLKAAAELEVDFREYEEQYKTDYMKRQGTERSDVFIPFDNVSEHSTMVLNAVQSLDANNSKPSIVTYYDSDGVGQNLELSDDQQRGVMNMFTNGNREDVKKISVSKLGDEVGVTVRFKPDERNEITFGLFSDDKEFDNGEAIEMFIPINTLTDPVTGRKHAPTQIFERLGSANPQLQYEVEKLVKTGPLSATPNHGDLGEAAVPAEHLFPSGKFAPKGSSLDFKIEYGEQVGRYTAPYIIDQEGNKEVARWDSVITPDLLEDNDESDEKIDAMLGSGLFDKILKSSRLVIEGGKSLYQKHNIGNNPTESDVRSLLEEMAKQEMRLPSHTDILEVSNFYKLTR